MKVWISGYRTETNQHVEPKQYDSKNYVDALTPNVTIFGDRAFKKIIKIK